MNLKGKTILITGAAKRIGRELSLLFAKAGASVIIHYNTSDKEAELLLSELKTINNCGHKKFQADLSIQNNLDLLSSELGSIDILINSASTYINIPLASENIKTAKQQFDVNFWAPYSLIQNMYKMRSDRRSVIINITDCWASSKISYNDGSYLISKSALEMLTRLSALQLAPNFRINALALGHVLPTKELEDLKMQESIKKAPLKKKVEIDEIFSSCLFLIENESITGEILYLDAGMHI